MFLGSTCTTRIHLLYTTRLNFSYPEKSFHKNEIILEKIITGILLFHTFLFFTRKRKLYPKNKIGVSSLTPLLLILLLLLLFLWGQCNVSVNRSDDTSSEDCPRKILGYGYKIKKYFLIRFRIRFSMDKGASYVILFN